MRPLVTLVTLAACGCAPAVLIPFAPSPDAGQVVDRPVVDQLEVDRPVVDQLEVDRPVVDQLEVDRPVVDQLEVDQLEVDRPVVDQLEVDGQVVDVGPDVQACRADIECTLPYRGPSAGIFARCLDGRCVVTCVRGLEWCDFALSHRCTAEGLCQ